jgi:hypothetical protein
MNFAEHQSADRRLVILRGLAECAQYCANSYLLQNFCDAVGHRVSFDRMQQDLCWLHEQSLVELEAKQGISVVTLTSRGLDVATGRVVVPGVQKPHPIV